MNNIIIRSSIGLDYSNLDLDTLDYDSFIKNFQIYPTYKKAKKKGFEAHHLIPLALQLKNFNIENNQNLDKEQFLKLQLENPISIRCTSFEHILIHYLLAKKFKGIYSLIFIGMCSVNSPKLLDFETLKIHDLYGMSQKNTQSLAGYMNGSKTLY